MSKNQLIPTTLGKVILFLLCSNMLFAQGQTVLTDPGSLTSFRSNIGISYAFSVTGTDQGSVWGGADGVYTDDSRLGKAAVHAGLLKVGEQGVVFVTILRGAPRYYGSLKNGISTLDYGSYSGSFKFEPRTPTGVKRAEPIITGDVLTDPGNLVKLRNNNGSTYSVYVTGTDQGSVWGGADGIYTDDSRLGKAAVHAGLLRVGEDGVVKVTIIPGAQRYLGSTRNGITTNHYGSFSGSFRFESVATGNRGIVSHNPVVVGNNRPAGGTTQSATGNVQSATGSDYLTDPGNLIKLRKNTGVTYSFLITGTTQGGVWGGEDGIYTDDSAIAKAAVHAGLVVVGEQKVVRVTILPGRQWYNGCSRNGITTPNYGSYAGSYRFEVDSPQTIAPQEDIGREVLSDPGNLTKFRSSIGETFRFLVTGTNQGGVWGGADGIYTDDSAIAKAAVHAGLVKLGEQAVVRVKILPGMQRYTGSPANGITTTNYGAFAGSFKFL